VDLSGLIFVALAVAWAAYLIPKALRHHDDVVRGRSIDRFSQSMRVLARREPVSARMAQLVVTPARATAAMVTTKPSARTPSPDEQYAERRDATGRATKRRRRVLTLLLVALAGVVGACADGRLMVRKERAWRPVVLPETADEADALVETPVAEAPPTDATERDPSMWDPVPVTLPTYVSKPPARRAVRTIDLDSTGVWTSGRTEADSALAREAEAAERVQRRASRKDDSGDEAVGS
jgi:hypothetical protein